LCTASKPVTNHDPSKLCPSQCEASWRRISFCELLRGLRLSTAGRVLSRFCPRLSGFAELADVAPKIPLRGHFLCRLGFSTKNRVDVQGVHRLYLPYYSGLWHAVYPSIYCLSRFCALDVGSGRE
jgi:hypothetical protein